MNKLNEKQYSIDLFQKLIQINTINELGTEKEAAIFLQGILLEEGIQADIIYSPKGRANLIAKLIGESSVQEEPLILLSHLDVVSANGDEWTVPPFSGSIHDQKIWGRGTLDTKQLTIMHLISFLSLNKKRLNRDVYLMATADEENGSSEGMEFLTQKYPDIFQRATVLSEGGGFTLHCTEQQDDMLFASGEKGTAKIRISASGTGGHAGSPPDNQAILKLAQVIDYLTTVEFPTEEYQVLEVFSEAITKNSFEYQADQKELVNKLLDYMKFPTLMVEDLNIGNQLNVIPYKADANIEIRTLPTQTKDQIENLIGRALENFDVTWELLFFQKGYESQYDSTIIELFQRKAESLGFRGRWIPFTALGKTDGRFISEKAKNIYGISPVLTLFTEVLKRVHQKNEYLEVDSFVFGVSLMRSVIEDYCISYGGG